MPTRTPSLVLAALAGACTNEPQVVAIRVEEPALRAGHVASTPTQPLRPPPLVVPSVARASELADKVELADQVDIAKLLPVALALPDLPPYDAASLEHWLTVAQQAEVKDLPVVISRLSQAHADAWPSIGAYLNRPLTLHRADLTHLRPLADTLPAVEDGFEAALLRFLAIDPNKVASGLRPLLRDIVVRQALLASMRQLERAPTVQRQQAVALAAELGSRERPWFGAVARAGTVALGHPAIFALHALARCPEPTPAARRQATWAIAMLDRMGQATPEHALSTLRAEPSWLRELVDVFAQYPDPTALQALMVLADDEQTSLRQSARSAIERMLRSGAIAERAAHKIIEVTANHRLSTAIERAPLLSASQLWQAFVRMADDQRRLQRRETIEVALANASPENWSTLLALIPEETPTDLMPAIAAALAERAEQAVTQREWLLGAQMARKAALFATLPEHVQRLRERAYGILAAAQPPPTKATRDPSRTAGGQLPLQASLGISALGATFMLALLRRRRRPNKRL